MWRLPNIDRGIVEISQHPAVDDDDYETQTGSSDCSQIVQWQAQSNYDIKAKIGLFAVVVFGPRPQLEWSGEIDISSFNTLPDRFGLSRLSMARISVICFAIVLSGKLLAAEVAASADGAESLALDLR